MIGFEGGNPDDNPNNQGNWLQGKLIITINNGVITSQSFTKTRHDNTSSNNMYYAYARLVSISIEKIL